LAFAASLVPARAESFGLSAPVSASGTFDVLVNVTGVFDSPHDSDFLLGYGFNVSFDSSVLSYLGETPGALFDDLSGIPGAEVAGVASAVLLGPGDFTEPLNLATLHFNVVGAENTSISITGDISDPNEGLIYLSSSDPISATTSLSAVPEPGFLASTRRWVAGILGRALGAPAASSGLRRARAQSWMISSPCIN
jgi:hypothetical protein